MDEPFPALDVITAETLRTDLLDLSSDGRDIYVHMTTGAQRPQAREDVFSGSGIAMVLPRGSSKLLAGLAGRPQVRSRAEETVQAVVSWARCAERFAYDKQADLFSLENPASVLPSIRRRRDLVSGTL